MSDPLPYCAEDVLTTVREYDKMINLDDIRRAINGRAGIPRSRAVLVYFSVNDDVPPSLQWYNRRTGKRTGARCDRGRRPKRVVVGRAWFRQNIPAEYAALCGVRIIDGHHPIEQLTVE